MFDSTMKYDMKWLAGTKDLDSHFIESVNLSEFRIHRDCFDFSTHSFYVVSYSNSEWDDMSYDLMFNDIRSAMKKFGELAKAKYRYSDGRIEPKYDKVEYCDDWRTYRDEIRRGSPIHAHDDDHEETEYGPSNPWDAPGMSVGDFIRGVY